MSPPCHGPSGRAGPRHGRAGLPRHAGGRDPRCRRSIRTRSPPRPPAAHRHAASIAVDRTGPLESSWDAPAFRTAQLRPARFALHDPWPDGVLFTSEGVQPSSSVSMDPAEAVRPAGSTPMAGAPASRSSRVVAGLRRPRPSTRRVVRHRRRGRQPEPVDSLSRAAWTSAAAGVPSDRAIDVAGLTERGLGRRPSGSGRTARSSAGPNATHAPGPGAPSSSRASTAPSTSRARGRRSGGARPRRTAARGSRARTSGVLGPRRRHPARLGALDEPDDARQAARTAASCRW